MGLAKTGISVLYHNSTRLINGHLSKRQPYLLLSTTRSLLTNGLYSYQRCRYERKQKKESINLLGCFAGGALFAYCSTAKMENDMSVIIKKADTIYNANDFEGLYNYLKQFEGTSNADILWRLARASKEYAELPGKSSDERKNLHLKALEYAKRSLELDNKNFACHKWYGIMLSVTGDYEGTKKKLQDSLIIQECFLNAIELNPNDATSSHLLGLWYFMFAELPWYQKKIAAALFASPPEATYEQALDCFVKAENVDPDFYSTNHLMLGKTYLRLNKKDEAKKWLEKVQNTKESTAAAVKNCKEAKELLQSI